MTYTHDVLDYHLLVEYALNFIHNVLYVATIVTMFFVHEK